jgi:hypothetical protein
MQQWVAFQFAEDERFWRGAVLPVGGPGASATFATAGRVGLERGVRPGSSAAHIEAPASLLQQLEAKARAKVAEDKAKAATQRERCGEDDERCLDELWAAEQGEGDALGEEEEGRGALGDGDDPSQAAAEELPEYGGGALDFDSWEA